MKHILVSLAALLALTAGVIGATQRVVFEKGPVSCEALDPAIERLEVRDFNYGFWPRPWGSASARLVYHSGKSVDYTIFGYAQTLEQAPLANKVIPTYTYAGVWCAAPHPRVTAVDNCGGPPHKRHCDIGFRFWGIHGFRVHLEIERTA